MVTRINFKASGMSLTDLQLLARAQVAMNYIYTHCLYPTACSRVRITTPGKLTSFQAKVVAGAVVVSYLKQFGIQQDAT